MQYIQESSKKWAFAFDFFGFIAVKRWKIGQIKWSKEGINHAPANKDRIDLFEAKSSCLGIPKEA